MNSTLLAQLAASEHHDRSEETDEWYKKYLYVLGKIGWVARPWKFVKAILSPSEIQAVERVLESLRSPQNEPWWNLFDEVHRSQFPSDIFPQRLLGSGGDGFGIVLFQSNGQRGALASTTPPMYSTQGATQNEVSYSTVREAVVNKLGDNAKTWKEKL